MRIKTTFINKATARLATFLLTLQALFFSVAVFAQNGGGNGGLDVNVDINEGKGGGAWYNNWWIWAIIVMIFIVIIVAITNRGKTNRNDAA